jgi:hypothetical protein
MERFVRDPESVWLSDLVVLGDWLAVTCDHSELYRHPGYQSIKDDPAWRWVIVPDPYEDPV